MSAAKETLASVSKASRPGEILRRMAYLARRKHLRWLGLGILTLLVQFVMFLNTWNSFAAYRGSSTHSHQVIKALGTFLSDLRAAETNQRGYLVTGQPEYLDPYHAAVAAVQEDLSQLRILPAGDANQQRRIDRLEPLARARLAKLEEGLGFHRTGGQPSPMEADAVYEGTALMDHIQSLVIVLLDEENSLVDRRNEDARAAGRTTVFVIACGSGLLLLILAASGRVIDLDITKRELAEEEVRRLNTELDQRMRERTIELEANNRELESFAYSISHDLRAPLRGIDGWSFALLEDYGGRLDERATQYLNQVRAEAQRMGQMIDDLLQLSRITRAPMEPGPVDLTAIAQSVAAKLQEAQPDRRMEFAIQPGLTANGDSRLLELALTNLLGNATKFTGRRDLAVIEFGCTQQGGEPAFYVRDNGVGFDLALAAKLFHGFQRLHKPSDFPGAGIGLATVQRIIHRHGGKLWAESQVDQGATFYFTLG